MQAQKSMRILSLFCVFFHTAYAYPGRPTNIDGTIKYDVKESKVSCLDFCSASGSCGSCDTLDGIPGYCCGPFDYERCNADMVEAVRKTAQRTKETYQCVTPLRPGDISRVPKISDAIYKEAFRFIWPYWKKSGTAYKRRKNLNDLKNLFYKLMAKDGYTNQNGDVGNYIVDRLEDMAIESQMEHTDDRVNAFAYAKMSMSYPIFRIAISLMKRFKTNQINVDYRDNNMMKLTRSNFNQMLPNNIDYLYSDYFESYMNYDSVQQAVLEMLRELHDEHLIDSMIFDATRMGISQIQWEEFPENYVLANIFHHLKDEIILGQLMTPSEVSSLFKILSLDQPRIDSLAMYVELLIGNYKYDQGKTKLTATKAVKELMEVEHIYETILLNFFEQIVNLTVLEAPEETFEWHLRKCLAHIHRPTVANPLRQIHTRLEACLPVSFKAELEILLKYNDNLAVLDLILTIVSAYDANESINDDALNTLFGCDHECDFGISLSEWNRLVPKIEECGTNEIITRSIYDEFNFVIPGGLETDNSVTGTLQQVATSGHKSNGRMDLIKEAELIDEQFIRQMINQAVVQSEIIDVVNWCGINSCIACNDPLIVEENSAGLSKIFCNCN